jgi:hypothetical protein
MSNLCIFPARALEDPTLSGSDIRVLAAIGKHVHSRTGYGCWASSKTLAKEAGVSISGFFASTKRLLAAGWIRRESRKRDGETSLYSVVFDPPRKRAKGVPPPIGGVSTPLDTPLSVGGYRVSGAPETTTINAPFNVPRNAPTTTAEFQTRGEKLFAEILSQKRYNRTATGSHPCIPKAVIDALPAPARQAWTNIGGTEAVLAADDTGVRVLQGRFGRHYASERAAHRVEESSARAADNQIDGTR